jgi:hypothetical protein
MNYLLKFWVTPSSAKIRQKKIKYKNIRGNAYIFTRGNLYGGGPQPESSHNNYSIKSQTEHEPKFGGKT